MVGSITGRARQPHSLPSSCLCLLWPPWRKQLHPTRSYSRPAGGGGGVWTCHSRGVLPRSLLWLLPVLPESSDAPAMPKLNTAAQLLGVKCRPECEAECLGWAATWWSTERTKQLSAEDRREGAGPDKRGEVYHELSSTEEETHSRSHPPISSSSFPPNSLPPSNCKNCEREKMAVISGLIQPVG